MNHAITIHTPSSTPSRLILLFHGVGARPTDLVPLGQSLARVCPQALIVSIQSPHPSGLGLGYEWFSVNGITESNRSSRVEQAMPGFLDTVRHWQEHAKVNSADTVLIGFSQGAIMSLESTQAQPGAAGVVISVAGRFAAPPQHSPNPTAVHGNADQVMPVGLADVAYAQLRALGANVTLERFEGLGHGIDHRVVNAVHKRLLSLAEGDTPLE
jgi:phospholipase/carboxylesterase